MPPLLRAADSMNSSSATAIPDTSKRTLRSQASLEIEAILSGAGARGDDAEFMRMIHGQQQQLAGGMGMSSQGTMVDELHPQPGAIGARDEGGPTRGKGGEKKSRRERERSVLHSGPRPNSFAFDLPDMSSQPAIPTLLSGPGPNDHLSPGEHSHHRHYSNSHSPIDGPGQSISPDQLRYTNDTFDPQSNTLAYIHMQAAHNGQGQGQGEGQGAVQYPIDLEGMDGMDGVDVVAPGRADMAIDIPLQTHGGPIDYRPQSAASAHSVHSVHSIHSVHSVHSAHTAMSHHTAPSVPSASQHGSEYSFSATDVSSVGHHANQDPYAQQPHHGQGQVAGQGHPAHSSAELYVAGGGNGPRGVGHSQPRVGPTGTAMAGDFAGMGLHPDMHSPEWQNQPRHVQHGVHQQPYPAPRRRGTGNANAAGPSNSASPMGEMGDYGHGHGQQGQVSAVGPIRTGQGPGTDRGSVVGEGDEDPAARANRLERTSLPFFLA